MTRRLSRLVEAQPGPFVEMSRGLAASLGVENGETVRIETARGAVEVPAMVTDRLRPLRIQRQDIEVLWAPMHYGPLGRAVGDSINRVTIDALEPNVNIQETKACLCRVIPLPRDT